MKCPIFRTLPEADRPDAATPNAFWSSAHDWTIVKTGTSVGGFTDLANAVFPVGSYTATVADSSVNLSFTPVPKPSTITMLVLGALGILAYAKRRNQNCASQKQLHPLSVQERG